MNLYAYVHNDPINMNDSDGKNAKLLEYSWKAGWAVGSGINYLITAAKGATLGVLIYDAVHNESANDGVENKGQTKPEVGDCPTCSGETSNKPGKIGQEHGMKPKEVKDAIHGIKGNANLPNNPDVIEDEKGN